MFLRAAPRRVRNQIVHAGKLEGTGLRQLGIQTSMFFAQRAGAENGNADGFGCGRHAREIAIGDRALTIGN
jgi:hypothetical protein